jgi:hypothetical protein
MVFSVHEELHTLSAERPHVVILGAGASAAACPKGDKHGRRLPVMNDLIDTVGLATELGNLGVDCGGRNFEVVYGELLDRGGADLCRTIESRVRHYFETLELPNRPTIYDHLVLSLRGKDVIATFNWDPFLVQAIRRNFEQGAMPIPLFLHGNVAIGYCAPHRRRGVIGWCCRECQQPFEPSKLLFPVKQKNYADDPFLKWQWDALNVFLRDAFVLTIFGYGAPESDVEALKLMKGAWGDPQERNLEEIEIIDIKSEDELRRSWDPFIHTHHCRMTSDFYESWIRHHPRRTIEPMWAELR